MAFIRSVFSSYYCSSTFLDTLLARNPLFINMDYVALEFFRRNERNEYEHIFSKSIFTHIKFNICTLVWDANSDFARIYIGGWRYCTIRHLYKPCASTVASVIEVWVCVLFFSIKIHFIPSLDSYAAQLYAKKYRTNQNRIWMEKIMQIKINAIQNQSFQKKCSVYLKHQKEW